MKLNVVALALAATAFGALSAGAQTTVIEQPAATVVAPAPPAVVVEQPAQSVTVEKNNLGILGNSTTTTVDTVGAGVDCRHQTTTTNTLLGSTTSSNETCN